MIKKYNVNTRIHKERAKYNIYMWQIASRYGLAESSMYRLLRKELPKDEQEKIVQIIRDIAGENYDSKSA